MSSTSNQASRPYWVSDMGEVLHEHTDPMGFHEQHLACHGLFLGSAIRPMPNSAATHVCGINRDGFHDREAVLTGRQMQRLD